MRNALKRGICNCSSNMPSRTARTILIVFELLMMVAISFIVIFVTSVPFTCVMSCPTEILPVASAWPPSSKALIAAPLPVLGFFISVSPSVLPSKVSSMTVPGDPTSVSITAWSALIRSESLSHPRLIDSMYTLFPWPQVARSSTSDTMNCRSCRMLSLLPFGGGLL